MISVFIFFTAGSCVARVTQWTVGRWCVWGEGAGHVDMADNLNKWHVIWKVPEWLHRSLVVFSMLLVLIFFNTVSCVAKVTCWTVDGLVGV